MEYQVFNFGHFGVDMHTSYLKEMLDKLVHMILKISGHVWLVINLSSSDLISYF